MVLSDEIVETIHDNVCGLYFRSVLLAKKGDRIAQHGHDHDHANYCGNGAAGVYVDGKMLGIVLAGGAVEIRAGKSHEFVALEDNTRLTCVHDVASAEGQRKL